MLDMGLNYLIVLLVGAIIGILLMTAKDVIEERAEDRADERAERAARLPRDERGRWLTPEA